MPLNIRRAIGDNIFRRRLALNMTQEELAFRSHMTTGYLGLIERGTVNPTVDRLHNVATALGVNIRDLAPQPLTLAAGDQVPDQYLQCYAEMGFEEREIILGVLDDLSRLRDLYRNRHTDV